MDINFHYFTVKTIARLAGFEEEKAQRIAFYSQLIDDYDIYSSISLDEVPGYAQYLAEEGLFAKWSFTPVTTGFNSWLDMARLILEKNQRKIIIPFHFIPSVSLFPALSDRAGYRTVPVSMKDGSFSLLQGKLKFLADIYRRNKDRDIQNENLIYIGMLLHTWADTYAHQGYSGSKGWENETSLTKVTNLIDNTDVTSKYKPVGLTPATGHAQADHAPDDTNISFSWKQKNNKDDNFTKNNSRENRDLFCVVAREILDYLLSCRNQSAINDNQWNAIEPRLRNSFMTSEKNVAGLCTHWKRIWPEFNYNYKKDTWKQWLEIVPNQNGADNITLDDVLYRSENNDEKTNEFLQSLILKVMDNDFFLYNVFADMTRREVNGCNKDEDLDMFISRHPL